MTLLVLLATASAADAQDKVLGLLKLPEVFGNGPCHAFEPSRVRSLNLSGSVAVAVYEVLRQCRANGG